MKKAFLAVFTLCCLIPALSEAQAYYFYLRIPEFYKNYEIEYGYPIAVADYKREDVYTDGSGAQHNTSYNMTVVSKFSYGVGAGYFFPLTRIGRHSSLNLSIGYKYNIITFDYKTPVLQSDGTYQLQDGDGLLYSNMSAQMALPIGLDWKFGCDGKRDRKYKFCSTIGAGIYPYYNLSMDMNLESDAMGFKGGFLPYVKGEIGIFAGICMKLRGMLIIGDMPFIDGTASPLMGGSDYKLSLIGKTSANVSIVFMPMSWAWKKSEWWNTFN